MQRPLPQGIEYLIEQFDTFAANRGESRRLPVVLLKRDPGAPGSVQESTARTVITGYRDRLYERDLDRTVDLVPHALLEDTDATAPETPPGEIPGAEIDPHVALLDAFVDQLENSMPSDAGELRLPRFHTCRAVLEVSVGAGSAAANDAGCATSSTPNSSPADRSWGPWPGSPAPPAAASW